MADKTGLPWAWSDGCGQALVGESLLLWAGRWLSGRGYNGPSRSGGQRLPGLDLGQEFVGAGGPGGDFPGSVGVDAGLEGEPPSSPLPPSSSPFLVPAHIWLCIQDSLLVGSKEGPYGMSRSICLHKCPPYACDEARVSHACQPLSPGVLRELVFHHSHQF